MHIPMIRSLALALAACSTLLLFACASSPISTEAAPQLQPCPAGQAAGARCWFGQDSAGAHYAMVMPAQWNGHLMLHAHGGPTLTAEGPKRVLEDLQRWNVWPRAGYALALSSFRQGGVAVRAAAEDTERVRRIFVQHVAKPDKTILHGQSWGAGVAAKGAEMFADGKPYDAVLLTSGVLAGGTRAYDFRLDLRVVYQVLCGNHPRPTEPAYPLWMGLPAGVSAADAQVAQRARECLGLGLPAAQRTPEQARKLATLTRVIRIPESSVQGHLNWSTVFFQDIVQRRTGGLNPFGNIGARYTGSGSDDSDAALNAAVQRYRADPEAVRRLAEDTDPQGRIGVPVLTVHAVDDPTAFVEMQSTFADTMARGGSAERLVQVFTAHAEHSYLADAVYVAAASALLEWTRRGTKPTPAGVAQACDALQALWGAGCRMLPDYRPAPLDSRVAPRDRP
jgi:hypothetical protein